MTIINKQGLLIWRLIMSKTENNEIRREILHILYGAAKNSLGSVRRSYLKEKLNLDDNELDFHVKYLDQKYYLETSRVSHAYFLTAKITAHGIDLVEDTAAFNREFPVKIIQIHNSPGTVIDSNNVNININNSFNHILKKIDHSKIENKDIVKEAVKMIEEELEKDCIKKDNIQEAMGKVDKFKGNANWIIPMIMSTIVSFLTRFN